MILEFNFNLENYENNSYEWIIINSCEKYEEASVNNFVVAKEQLNPQITEFINFNEAAIFDLRCDPIK